MQTTESRLPSRRGLLIVHVGDGGKGGGEDHLALLPSFLLLLFLLLRLLCPLALNCRGRLEKVTPFGFWWTALEKRMGIGEEGTVLESCCKLTYCQCIAFFVRLVG